MEFEKYPIGAMGKDHDWKLKLLALENQLVEASENKENAQKFNKIKELIDLHD